jgi:chromosome segregation ATPase
MEQDDLAPLIAFIGEKFEQVDRRLDQMATKEEVREQQAETRRHMGVLLEAVRDDIRQVAEGLVGVESRLGSVEQRLDRVEQKMETEFGETRAMIRVSYAQLDERIQSLEHNYTALNERVTRLESGRARP